MLLVNLLTGMCRDFEFVPLKNGEISSAGRLLAWRMALEMAKDHPFSGVGFHYSAFKMTEYKDPETGYSFDRPKGIHNSFLLVAAEEGILGLIVFLLIFLLNFRCLIRIKKSVRMHLLEEKFSIYASMLQISFIGYFTAGFFLNLSYIDIPWHFIGLSVALDCIVRKKIREESEITGEIKA